MKNSGTQSQLARSSIRSRYFTARNSRGRHENKGLSQVCTHRSANGRGYRREHLRLRLRSVSSSERNHSYDSYDHQSLTNQLHSSRGSLHFDGVRLEFCLRVVRGWNGSDRQTTFVSSSQLTAQISASDIVATGTAAVTVFNPGSSLFKVTASASLER
jgi:hypothetical protein